MVRLNFNFFGYIKYLIETVLPSINNYHLCLIIIIKLFFSVYETLRI